MHKGILTECDDFHDTALSYNCLKIGPSSINWSKKGGTPSTHSKFRRWRLVNPGISSPPARSLSRSQCTPRANSSFLQFRIRGLVSISNFVASKTRWERKEKVEIKITALFSVRIFSSQLSLVPLGTQQSIHGQTSI